MELDQKIFQFFWNRLEALKTKKDPPYTCYFEELKDSLQIWARAVTGLEIEISVNQNNPYGGCAGILFYYPEKISLFNDKLLNKQFYLFRTLYMGEILKQNLFLEKQIDINQNVELSKKYYNIIINNLIKQYPIIKEFLENHLINLTNESILYLTGLLYPKLMLIHHSTHDEDKKYQHNLQNIKTELKGTINTDTIEILQENKKKQEEYTLMHNFEKIETIEEFTGNWRDMDGEDELKDHSSALRDIEHKYLIRSDEQIQSVYKTEFSWNSIQLEVQNQVLDRKQYFSYDEWDEKKRSYKKNYVKVYPEKFDQIDREYYTHVINKYQKEIKKLKKIINQHYNKTIIKNRQIDGNDIDFDAYVNYFCEVHSKKTPEESIYLNKLLKMHEFIILILMDQSLSTDGYVENHRIIDLEKEAIIILGEIFKDIAINFYIAGFYSKTRNQIYYNILKDFHEPWTIVQNRVGKIEPLGYTRIGAAIRHSNNLLREYSYSKKWVIVLSDGKPNDYDKYEGRYGIYDVKQSIREGRKNQIHYFGIALDKEAKFYLPLMFGQSHYKILNHTNQLLNTLTSLILKITTSN